MKRVKMTFIFQWKLWTKRYFLLFMPLLRLDMYFYYSINLINLIWLFCYDPRNLFSPLFKSSVRSGIDWSIFLFLRSLIFPSVEKSSLFWKYLSFWSVGGSQAKPNNIFKLLLRDTKFWGKCLALIPIKTDRNFSTLYRSLVLLSRSTTPGSI